MFEGVVEWAVAFKALAGEKQTGDKHIVTDVPGGILVAVVDGLGHGDEAAVAADVAINTIKEHAHKPLDRIISACHESLIYTRGVVMSVAYINAEFDTITWAGVGNVEGLLIHHNVLLRDWLASRGGVVGYQLPLVHISTLPIMAGDVLLFVTDGIRSNFSEGLVVKDPETMAQEILAGSAKETDDALVLVVQYNG